MASLVLNGSELAVSRFDLREGINTIGRSEGNHHVIAHGSISSRHCEVVVQDGKISVRDLGSTNGTLPVTLRGGPTLARGELVPVTLRRAGGD